MKSTRQHTATHSSTPQHKHIQIQTNSRASTCVLQHTAHYTLHATHCNSLQLTATHCNTATHCSTLQHTAAHYNTLHRTVIHCTHCNTLQHSAIHCNTLEHTVTHLHVLHVPLSTHVQQRFTRDINHELEQQQRNLV